ncbi:hypothetical protein T439DRAFT_381552 [Meredithblackwellia eburnea MCA 4105]
MVRHVKKQHNNCGLREPRKGRPRKVEQRKTNPAAGRVTKSLQTRKQRRRPSPPSDSSGSGSGSDSDSSESESEATSSIARPQQLLGSHNSVQQGNLSTPHPDQLSFPPWVFDRSHELAHDSAQGHINPASSSNFDSHQSMFNTSPQQGHIDPSNLQHFQSNIPVNAFSDQVAPQDNLGPFFPEYSGHQERFLPTDELHHHSEASNLMFNPQSQLGLASQTSPLPQGGNHVGYDGAFHHTAPEVAHIPGHVPDTLEGINVGHDANFLYDPFEGLNLSDPSQFQPVQGVHSHEHAHFDDTHEVNMHLNQNTENNPGPWWAGSLGSDYHRLRRRSKRKAVLLRKWAEDQ